MEMCVQGSHVVDQQTLFTFPQVSSEFNLPTIQTGTSEIPLRRNRGGWDENSFKIRPQT